MGFGLSFGSKKQSSTTNSTINKDTTTSVDQTQNTAQQSSQTGSTSTTGSQTTTGDSLNINQSSGATSGSQTSTGTTTTLGQDVQDALSERVQAILASGITDANLATLSNAVSGNVGSFDSNSYIEGIVGAARNAGEAQLQETNSAFASQVGGTAATNSMAALLAQRGRNDLEANIAGIRAKAMESAAGINNANLAQSTATQATLAEIANGLTSTLKGATTTADTQTLTDEIQKLLGTQTSSTAQSTQTQEQQNTALTQLLTSLTSLLGTTVEDTTATEFSKTKGKSSGGGLSLSI